MLIALAFYFVAVALPHLGTLVQALSEPLMTVVITLCGIVMIFGAVGLKISENLGSTIVGGFFRAMGYICRTIVSVIGWIFRRMLPNVFNGSRRTFRQMGISPFISTILAIVVLVVII